MIEVALPVKMSRAIRNTRTAMPTGITRFLTRLADEKAEPGLPAGPFLIGILGRTRALSQRIGGPTLNSYYKRAIEKWT